MVTTRRGRASRNVVLPPGPSEVVEVQSTSVSPRKTRSGKARIVQANENIPAAAAKAQKQSTSTRSATAKKRGRPAKANVKKELIAVEDDEIDAQASSTAVAPRLPLSEMLANEAIQSPRIPSPQKIVVQTQTPSKSPQKLKLETPKLAIYVSPEPRVIGQESESVVDVASPIPIHSSIHCATSDQANDAQTSQAAVGPLVGYSLEPCAVPVLNMPENDISMRDEARDILSMSATDEPDCEAPETDSNIQIEDEAENFARVESAMSPGEVCLNPLPEVIKDDEALVMREAPIDPVMGFDLDAESEIQNGVSSAETISHDHKAIVEIQQETCPEAVTEHDHLSSGNANFSIGDPAAIECIEELEIIPDNDLFDVAYFKTPIRITRRQISPVKTPEHFSFGTTPIGPAKSATPIAHTSVRPGAMSAPVGSILPVTPETPRTTWVDGLEVPLPPDDWSPAESLKKTIDLAIPSLSSPVHEENDQQPSDLMQDSASFAPATGDLELSEPESQIKSNSCSSLASPTCLDTVLTDVSPAVVLHPATPARLVPDVSSPMVAEIADTVDRTDSEIAENEAVPISASSLIVSTQPVADNAADLETTLLESPSEGEIDASAVPELEDDSFVVAFGNDLESRDHLELDINQLYHHDAPSGLIASPATHDRVSVHEIDEFPLDDATSVSQLTPALLSHVDEVEKLDAHVQPMSDALNKSCNDELSPAVDDGKGSDNFETTSNRPADSGESMPPANQVTEVSSECHGDVAIPQDSMTTDPEQLSFISIAEPQFGKSAEKHIESNPTSDVLNDTPSGDAQDVAMPSITSPGQGISFAKTIEPLSPISVMEHSVSPAAALRMSPQADVAPGEESEVQVDKKVRKSAGRRQSRRQSYMTATKSAVRERELEFQHRQEASEAADLRLVAELEAPDVLLQGMPGSVERKRSKRRSNSTSRKSPLLARLSEGRQTRSRASIEAHEAFSPIKLDSFELTISQSERSATKIQALFRGWRVRKHSMGPTTLASSSESMRPASDTLPDLSPDLSEAQLPDEDERPSSKSSDVDNVFSDFLSKWQSKRSLRAQQEDLPSDEPKPTLASTPRRTEAGVMSPIKSDKKPLVLVAQVPSSAQKARKPASRSSRSRLPAPVIASIALDHGRKADIAPANHSSSSPASSPIKSSMTDRKRKELEPAATTESRKRPRLAKSSSLPGPETSFGLARPSTSRSKSSSATIVSTSSILQPRTPKKLNHLTPAEVAKTTKSFTMQNRLYRCDFDRVVVRKDIPRPPSPTAKIQSKMAASARTKRRKVMKETGYTLGAGDDEDYCPKYITPTRKAVKWGDDLETNLFNLIKTSPTKVKTINEISPCIAPSSLDDYGNCENSTPLTPELGKAPKVVITKYLYKGEQDD